MSNPETNAPLVLPFRGIRYAESELSALVCPPYDIISPAEREELYRRDPHNAIRLEFPLPRGGEDCYQAAAREWQAWREQGVLQQDAEALYLCRAEFEYRGRACSRLGLFAGLHLESLQNGRVLPHEGTLAAAKADRLALMQATNANFSPIWTIYHNPPLVELLAKSVAGEPLARAKTDDGACYSLWSISDRERIAQVCGLLGNGPIFIADGHHRYETALAYSQQQPSANPTAPVNYVLSLLVEADDPGLVILPTHRALAGVTKEQLSEVWAHLRDCCELERFTALEALLEWVYAGEHSFGFYTRQDGFWLFTVKEPLALCSDTMSSAPVAILHRRILDPALGREVKFGYYKEAEQTKEAVDAGEFDAAFFVRPLRSQELIQAAQSRERLPGKSTYFWPKIPAGLVMRSLS